MNHFMILDGVKVPDMAWEDAENKFLTDGTIVVGNFAIPVHWYILSWRSNYIKVSWQNDIFLYLLKGFLFHFSKPWILMGERNES